MATLLRANDGDIIALPWGEIQLHNNEVHIVSSVDDPPGVSFKAPGPSRSLGKVSFKNHSGVEMVLIQGKEREDGIPGGEIYVGILDQRLGDGDHAMIEVATLKADGITFHVPINLSAQTDHLQSGTGRFKLYTQSDGNLVLYDTSISPWEALWNSGTVVV